MVVDIEKTFKRFMRTIEDMQSKRRDEDVIEVVLKDGSIKRYFPLEVIKERKLELVRKDESD